MLLLYTTCRAHRKHVCPYCEGWYLSVRPRPATGVSRFSGQKQAGEVYMCKLTVVKTSELLRWFETILLRTQFFIFMLRVRYPEKAFRQCSEILRNRTSSESPTFSHTPVNKAASQLYKPVKTHRTGVLPGWLQAEHHSMLLAQMLNIQLCTAKLSFTVGALSLSVSVCVSPEPSYLTTPVCLLSYSNPHPVYPVTCPFSHLD